MENIKFYKSRTLKFITDMHMADETGSAYVSSADQTTDLKKIGALKTHLKVRQTHH